eukprot:GAHX01005945.1.p1 GENE.GAHX01005945.1~~GAHX01005945.1.p1  ORF type:complete len:191 (+),score=21.99 GAHX01005945.1:205-777(+)
MIHNPLPSIKNENVENSFNTVQKVAHSKVQETLDNNTSNSKLHVSIHSKISSIERDCKEMSKFPEISGKLKELSDLISSDQQSNELIANYSLPSFNKRKIVVKQKEISKLVKSGKSLNFIKNSKRGPKKVKEIVESFALCIFCFELDDNLLTEHVKWIGCLKCSKWFHKHCLSMDESGMSCNYVCCDGTH